MRIELVMPSPPAKSGNGSRHESPPSGETAAGPPRRRAARGRIRVLLVGDQALFREAIHLLLEQQPDIDVVAEVASLTAGLPSAVVRKPDVVVTALSSGEVEEVSALKSLRNDCPGIGVVVLMGLDGAQTLSRVLSTGVRGVVLKSASSDLVVKAIRAVHAGETWVQREVVDTLASELRRLGSAADERDGSLLSQRETEVLTLLATGRSTAEISGSLFVAESTVRVHLLKILRKLGLRNRVEAVRHAIREGLVQL